MRKFYNDQMLAFLRDNAPLYSRQELTDRFNARFGTSCTKGAIAVACDRRGWGNGRFHKSSVFPDEVRRFMEEHCRGNRAREMQQLLKEAFGREWSIKQISCYYRKHGLKSGVAPRHVPIGTLIFRTGEWYYEKIADGPDTNANWRSKHVLVWEEAHGPVPSGNMVIFLDGDRRNHALDNLALCPYDVGMEINRRGLRFTDPEATKAGMLIGRLCLEIRRRSKEG